MAKKENRPPLAPAPPTVSRKPAPPVSPSGDRPRLTRRQIIHDAAETVSEHISRQPHVQRLFSFMPTLMTRVSPFHFRNRNRLKEWPLVRLDSGNRDSWGQMSVVGELLVIFDETVLLCLLSLMNQTGSDVFETRLGDICDLSLMKRTQANFTAIWKSVQRLAGTRIDLNLQKGKGKSHRTVKAMTGSIFSYGDLDKETGALRVVINPYFLEMYADSFVTNIDLQFRASLKSDVSKAFYRYYQGQLGSTHETDLARLARAVNLPAEATGALSAKIRPGLRELEKKGYLKGFEISPQGAVSIEKLKGMAVNAEHQILGLDKFHISKIGGPGSDLAE
jgi:hypothetical protein